MKNQDKYTNQSQVPSVRFCETCKFIIPDNGQCEQCFKDANEAFGDNCDTCGTTHDEKGYGFHNDGEDCIENPDNK